MKRLELPKILFEQIKLVEPYPPGEVIRIAKLVEKTAFFPGGLGLWTEKEYNNFPEIIVLGQDFSNVIEYERFRLNSTNNLESPTWRNLKKVFDETKIDMSKCFFTNAFMGLRATKSMVGIFPGYKDKEFVNRNVEFLKLQIETIKPKAIITLGKIPTKLLGRLSSDLEQWKNGKALEGKDNGLVYNVNFGKHSCQCLSLVHPSMRNSNVKHRKYENLCGDKAELKMLSDLSKRLSK